MAVYYWPLICNLHYFFYPLHHVHNCVSNLKIMNSFDEVQVLHSAELLLFFLLCWFQYWSKLSRFICTFAWRAAYWARSIHTQKHIVCWSQSVQLSEKKMHGQRILRWHLNIEPTFKLRYLSNYSWYTSVQNRWQTEGHSNLQKQREFTLNIMNVKNN